MSCINDLLVGLASIWPPPPTSRRDSLGFLPASICPPPPPTSCCDSLVGSPGLHLPSTTPNDLLGVLPASICPPSPPTSLTTTRWWFPGFQTTTTHLEGSSLVHLSFVDEL